MAETLIVLALCLVWVFLLPRDADFAIARPVKGFPWVPAGVTTGIFKLAGLMFVAAPVTYIALRSSLRPFGLLSAALIAWTAWSWLVALARR